MASQEYFQALFASMRQGLEATSSQSKDLQNPGTFRMPVSSQLSECVARSASRSLETKAAILRRRHTESAKRRAATIAKLQTRKDAFLTLLDDQMNQNRSRALIQQRRLDLQMRSINQRLRELLFECLGEYAKAQFRAAHRHRYLAQSVEQRVNARVEGLQWSRFGIRLQEDALGTIKVTDIDPEKLHKEFEQWAELCRKQIERIQGGRNYTVKRAFKIKLSVGSQQKQKRGQTGKGSNEPNQIYGPDNTVTGVVEILKRTILHQNRGIRQMASAMGKGFGNTETSDLSPMELYMSQTHPRFLMVGACHLPQADPSHLVSSHACRWLVLANQLSPTFQQQQSNETSKTSSRQVTSDYQIPVGGRVYYCLEERAAALKSKRGASSKCQRQDIPPNAPATAARVMAEALQTIYLQHNQIDENPNQVEASNWSDFLKNATSFEVKSALGNHRHMWTASELQKHDLASSIEMEDLDYIQSYPDVLKVEVTSRDSPTARFLHFAPATVLQLVEASSFRSFYEKLSIKDRAHIMEMYPPTSTLEAGLENLYCPLQALYDPQKKHRANALVGCKMSSLSSAACAELFLLYLVRSDLHPCPEDVLEEARHGFQKKHSSQNPNTSIPSLPSCMSLLENGVTEPTEVLDRFYCCILNPQLPDKRLTMNESPVSSRKGLDSEDNDHTLSSIFFQLELVPLTENELDIDGEESYASADLDYQQRQQAALNYKRSARWMWDATVLSSLCRWRACLASSTPQPPPKYLCALHAEIKTFLDSRTPQRGQVVAESSRYLPKRPPEKMVTHSSLNGSDLALIKAASSLLQEMFKGKLVNTISTFCQRAASEASDKYRYEQTRRKAKKNQAKKSKDGKGPVPSFLGVDKISWSQWSDKKEIEKANNLLNYDIQVIQQTFFSERVVTKELHKLMQLGTFPGAELSMIRKQSKAIEELEENRKDDDNDGAGHNTEYHHADLEVELDFAEKKRLLLCQRREEVENSGIPSPSYIMVQNSYSDSNVGGFRDPNQTY